MMICIRGAAMSLILNYLAAFLLLTRLFSTDAKPIFPQTLNQFSDNKNPPTPHKVRRGSHANGIHGLRSDVALLGERSLVKRGNCFSSQENVWNCDAETPSVAECVTRIQSYGQVGSRISVFYSGLGGAQGLTACKQYFSCNAQIGPVVPRDTIVDPGWFTAQAQAIIQDNPGANLDPFQKRMSQAFAEASRGDTYICTPEDNAPNNDFNQDLAWGGWEYPALTRNPGVTRIIRVDPNTSVTRAIWTQGDPATPNAPRG
jgi:hypothetical protein